ncbi:MAG: DNA-processing protein DprA, partial [Planctomycetales bacterium]|nr:DNA-processing protein DprA [Planctomycetales bacterium]
DVARELQLCQEHQLQLVVYGDPEYPQLLTEIPDAPPLLFARGRLAPQDGVAIAIVGSRHATGYGKTVAERLASGLARAGFTIVSGLARGIDAAAHRGALDAGGRTIAVLASGVLSIYPPEHDGLANEVASSGAVVSEHPPLAKPLAGTFPQRNRIITGLCLGVIVVEATQRSGALISARHAMEQNREVFAVPGRIDQRTSQGCHRLIRDGARLVESVDDVLEELGPLAEAAVVGEGDSQRTLRHPAELKLNDQERKVLDAIELAPTSIDRVAESSGLPIGRVLSTISVLEVRKLVARVSGSQVQRR